MSRLAFWFDFASPYSYLAALRIEALATAAGVPVDWTPFLLGPIFQDKGWNDSPLNLDRARGEYAWKDLARQAAKHGIPWRRPSVFPRNGVLAARVALLLDGSPAMVPFVRACMRQNFAHDADIATPAALHGILHGLGLDAEATLGQAVAPANRARLRANVETARSAGIFGAPSFVVDGELFWGNDRLEDALACACAGRNEG